MTEDTFTPALIPEALPTTSPEIDKLATALCKAQGVMGAVAKDKDNEFFHSKYATLAGVVEVAKKPLADNGLSVVQLPSYHVRGLALTTRLMHSSGQWIDATLVMPLDKKTAQGIGSCLTYARRYGLMAMLGIPAEDDDGNEASKPPPRSQKRAAPKATGAQVAAFNQLTRDMDPEEVAMGLEQHGVSDFRELDKKKADGILKTLRKRVNQPKSGTVSKLSDEEAAKAEKVSKKWADGGDDLASELDAEDAQTEANYRPVIESEEPPPPPENHNALWHKTGTDKWYEFYDGTWTFYDGPKPEAKK